MCDECRKKMQGMPKELQEMLEKLRGAIESQMESQKNMQEVAAEKAKAAERGMDGTFYFGEQQFFYHSEKPETVDAVEQELIRHIDALNVMPGSFWVEAGKHMARAFISMLRVLNELRRLGDDHENKGRAMGAVHDHAQNTIGMAHLMAEVEARAELDRAMGGLKLPEGPGDTVN